MRKKKRRFIAFVLVMTLVLTTTMALADENQWSVTDFLFGKPNEAAEPFVQKVSSQAENDLVRIKIDSALCDGQSLAFDWTVTPLDTSRYCQLSVEEFSANGEQLWLDHSDEFDGQWLPNTWTEETGMMQDGDLIQLPDGLKNADTLAVKMVIGVYEPTKPVYVLPNDDSGRHGFDPELALEKIRQGYLVIFDPDGWVREDAEEEDGVACVVGFIPEEDEPFTRTELNVSFTVEAAACTAAAQQLTTRPVYQHEKFTARYDRALLTPIGLYLDIVLTQKPGISAEEAFADFNNGGFDLTDGEGKKLELLWPTGGGGGGETIERHMLWLGLAREELPPQVSLSYLSDDGNPLYIFPAGLV